MVAVTCGSMATLEEVTRPRTQLILILVEGEYEDYKQDYPDYQKYFQNAARQGLIELFVMKREGQEYLDRLEKEQEMRIKSIEIQIKEQEKIYFDKLESQFKVMQATIEEQQKMINSLEMVIQEKEKKCCVLS